MKPQKFMSCNIMRSTKSQTALVLHIVLLIGYRFSRVKVIFIIQ
jgi:hypothetical protein